MKGKLVDQASHAFAHLKMFDKDHIDTAQLAKLFDWFPRFRDQERKHSFNKYHDAIVQHDWDRLEYIQALNEFVHDECESKWKLKKNVENISGAYIRPGSECVDKKHFVGHVQLVFGRY